MQSDCTNADARPLSPPSSWILFFTLIPIAMAAVKRPSVERQHGKETEHF